ncbi:MAG: hydrogenase expression/formation protein [Thiobacillaceae bacterium]|nr:hydrogenase expression/formation protein [Thiobacillaceae bacterium]MCX7672136.1 hydrogenase expression/formation protein [Thiobacillaceae bacterium]MDW8324399.1 hydrogenase expression/formation C-terminal domain-containing protein [Burkholderiales bacterium]
MGLEAIPVVVEPADLAAARAVLRELAVLVERLLATGEGGAIDLGVLPLTPAARAWLIDRLGRGEVEIRLTAGGQSTITETGCAGVWWVRHGNEAGVVTSELLEVAYVPGLVPVSRAEVENGLQRLNSGLDGLN